MKYKIMNDLISDGTIPIPEYATNGSAGMDLRACISKKMVLYANETILIPTGIAIHIENSTLMGEIVPRSGLGYKHGIILANTVGIIDSDYQGEIFIPLYNRSDIEYTIQPGERIAQIIFSKIKKITLERCEQFKDTSERGSGGFGHSGKL
jgi:dUTP pyrophosphatase